MIILLHMGYMCLIRFMLITTFLYYNIIYSTNYAIIMFNTKLIYNEMIQL